MAGYNEEVTELGKIYFLTLAFDSHKNSRKNMVISHLIHRHNMESN